MVMKGGFILFDSKITSSELSEMFPFTSAFTQIVQTVTSTCNSKQENLQTYFFGMDSNNLVNINVGVLGHVDSGKTSLCKTLSTTASTAAFDSNPQSKERGITLDLGFSAFTLDNKWNITLVDCPGHSSLIRTILGGVQIMDIMLLVIDVNKGMQAQAAECLILANICCANLIVVFNKVDLIEKDSKKVEALRKRMCTTLAKTKFVGEPIVCVSATDAGIGTSELETALTEKLNKIKIERLGAASFVMAVDHCFAIKGSGTICTGTILQGGVAVGDTIEFPELQITKKVKSMQMFRKPITKASAGDRIALGIPGLEAKQIERGIISSPGVIKSGTQVAVIRINRIQYYNRPIESKRRYHITIGYSTVTALVYLFGEKDEATEFNLTEQYEHVEEIEGESQQAMSSNRKHYFALLEFDKPITTLPNALVIGSNLQMVEDNTCRLAFSGMVLEAYQDKEYHKTIFPQLKIFRWKSKTGSVDRFVSTSSLIVKGFCQRSSNIDHLIGLKVNVCIARDNVGEKEPVAVGRIESRFGQTDKVRISIDSPLSDEVADCMKANLKGTIIEIRHKKYIFRNSDNPKVIVQ